jgi:large subunit ribosomal protein L23
MIIANNILREFRVTEKAANLAANLNQYSFEVDPRANRKEIARAVEKVFNVTVTKVNILIRKPKVKTDRSRGGRPGTKGGHKRAIVSLKEGDKIELV